MTTLWNRKAHETLEASTGRTVPLDTKTLGLTIREPYGVVAAIVPYNMPVGDVQQQGCRGLGGREHGGRQAARAGQRWRRCASASCLNEILPPGR